MADTPRPIIIKKVKKGGHGGHHGGAWKVAYADFVTAMMAFFLLMWLLNSTDPEVKKGLSAYFGPIGKQVGAGGAGGVLGGTSFEKEGSYYQKQNAAPPDPGADSQDQDEESPDADGQSASHDVDKKNVESKNQQEAKQKASLAEEELFKETRDALERSFEQNAELKKYARNVLIKETREGLQIQIIDQDPTAMFPKGSAVMYAYTRDILKKVAEVIGKLPNDITITGHTDSLAYSASSVYTNWELSSDRANATRRALMESQFPENRIASVNGKADRDPLVASIPNSDQNRRLEILLLRLHSQPEDHTTDQKSNEK